MVHADAICLPHAFVTIKSTNLFDSEDPPHIVSSIVLEEAKEPGTENAILIL